MFKNPVVLGACVVIYLHLITACSVVETQSSVELSASSMQAIAHELVAAIAAHSHDTTQPIYVRADGEHDSLRKALIAELNEKQYLLTNDANAKRYLAVTSTDLGANGIHVSLTLDGHRPIERVFRFEPAYTLKSRIDSVSFQEISATAAMASYASDPQVNVRNEPQAAESEVLADATLTRNLPANLPEATESPVLGACTDVVLRQGSLKRNLVRIMESCGWRLSNWPADPNRPHHELDWLVPHTQTLTVESLEELLDTLRSTFDLDIELNHRFKSVRIQLRD